MSILSLAPLIHLSLQTWLLIFPLGLVVYWILWIVYCRTLHPLAKVPGPFLASISRLWYIRRILAGDMERVQRDLHARYGPLIRIAHNEVACADRTAVKRVYRMQRPLQKTDFYPVWGAPQISKHPDMFTCTDEKVHSERRRIVNRVYSLSNVLKGEEYIDSCSALFLERLGGFADKGQVFDLGEWLQMYTFDVIGELYFGRKFGFLEKSEDIGSYIYSLDTLMPTLCSMAIAPSYARPFFLVSAIVFPAVRKALGAVKYIGTSAQDCVKRRNDEIERGVQPRKDLLQQLIEIARDKGDKVSFGISEVMLETYIALFAGSDTTAIAFRSIFYYLMKNPATYTTLIDELDAAASSGSLSSPVKYSEAIKLPYLSAVIKEAMRLHPSVGLSIPRLVPPEGIELCGVYIPAGYRIGINGAVIHYNKDVFGEDAEQFRPERWLEDRNIAEMERWMIHFGAGTRTCIGKNISIAELHKLVPFLLQNFTLEMAHDQPWKTKNQWFNKQTGIETKIKRRP